MPRVVARDRLVFVACVRSALIAGNQILLGAVVHVHFRTAICEEADVYEQR